MNAYRRISIMAGIGYLVIFITGIYANFFVLESLIVPENPEMTLVRIGQNLSVFRTGILAFIVMVVADVILAWALYELFRKWNAGLARFMAWFRLVNCVLFGAALVELIQVHGIVAGKSYMIGWSATQTGVEVMRSLSAFNNMWLIGLVFFGVHLLALGALLIRGTKVNRIIATLLLIAGAGYLVDSFAQFTLVNYAEYKDLFATIVIVPGVIGELSLTFWLLLRGGKTRRLAYVPMEEAVI